MFHKIPSILFLCPWFLSRGCDYQAYAGSTNWTWLVERKKKILIWEMWRTSRKSWMEKLVVGIIKIYWIHCMHIGNYFKKQKSLSEEKKKEEGRKREGESCCCSRWNLCVQDKEEWACKGDCASPFMWAFLFHDFLGSQPSASYISEDYVTNPFTRDPTSPLALWRGMRENDSCRQKRQSHQNHRHLF